MPKSKQHCINIYMDRADAIKLVQAFVDTATFDSVTDEYEPTSFETRQFQANFVLAAPGTAARRDTHILIEKTGPGYNDYRPHGPATPEQAQKWEDQNPPEFRQQIPDVKFVKSNKYPREQMVIELEALRR